MCGVVGLIETTDFWRLRAEQVALMVRHLAHRGPDGVGVACDQFCALGHSRLAIMDPANGSQPVSDIDGRYWLSYNGEVYNYRILREELKLLGHEFKGDCDTEVVLKSMISWGVDALPRFNGGFAFAFYDRVDQRLILARDRYGKRPLFYTSFQGGLAFASEMKAFLALPDFQFSFDKIGLAELFYGSSLGTGDTVFKGIQELRPGKLLEWRHGRMELRQHSLLPIDQKQYAGSYAEAQEELQKRLFQATHLRRRSDRAVGVLVSGGLDSSIVIAEALSEPGGPDRAFSVAFGEAAFDESEKQKLIVDRYGIKHDSLRVEISDIAQSLPSAVWHAETPLHCTAPVPMLLLAREVKRQGVSVVLTGEGADEAFLGYDLFKEVRLRTRVGGAAIDDLYNLYRKWGSIDEKHIRTNIQRSNDPDHPLFSHLMRFNASKLASRLLLQPMKSDQYLDRWQQCQVYCGQLPQMRRAQTIEYHNLLAGYLLSSQGDRMFSAHGVENRAPFLDNDVVEFAFSLPEVWCLSEELEEKRILRSAYRNRLPSEISDRPKQSYVAPDLSFIKSPNFEQLVQEYLIPFIFSSNDFLDADYVLHALNRCRKTLVEDLNRSDSNALILALTTSILHRQFVIRKHPLIDQNSSTPTITMAKIEPMAKSMQ
jgi:asparagine synthase (glutamine-hydrolysing)